MVASDKKHYLTAQRREDMQAPNGLILDLPHLKLGVQYSLFD